MDELENQRNHEQHHQVHHHHHPMPLPHQEQLYSPSPARKSGITSSLTGQKGSDTSGASPCPCPCS